jgi:hypothetical protein
MFIGLHDNWVPRQLGAGPMKPSYIGVPGREYTHSIARTKLRDGYANHFIREVQLT